MAYTVSLNPSGKVFSIESESFILDTAIQANIHLPHSCRNGSCGVCKSRLLKGAVEHLEGMCGISSEDREDGYILTCVAKPKSDLEIEANYYAELDGIKSGIFPCKVSSIEFPSDDIMILKLRFPPNINMRYLPGQYIDLMWKGMRRSYSIADTVLEPGIELHIKHVPDGRFSKYLFDELKPEILLRINGPHGTFFVRESHAPVIFLAGGTGFAPVKAMVEQLLKNASTRQIYIYWGARTIDAFYTNTAELWQEEHDNITYIPVLSNDSEIWHGRQGFVHQAVMQDINDLSAFEVYACGSSDMIMAAKNDFIMHGLIEKNFFADAFTPFKQTK